MADEARYEVLRLAGGVVRCHSFPTIRKPTIAEHTWNAMMIARQLWPEDMKVREYLQVHDLCEFDTGDTPAHAKWRWPELKRTLDVCETEAAHERGLTELFFTDDLIKIRAKFADWLEFAWFCIDEMRLGNKFIVVEYDRILGGLMKKLDEHFDQGVHAMLAQIHAIRMKL